jgi:hypothetical protein
MLTIAGETFELDDLKTAFYGWLDPYDKGRKPRLKWDLLVHARAREMDVRILLPRDFEWTFDFPVRNLSPVLDFSEIEIETTDWRSIAGFSTEDCSPFSLYVIGEFDHLAMETCSLRFLRRQGAVFAVEFSGEGGQADCGVGFSFYGLVDVPLRGIGMYFLPNEKDPVGAGRRLMKQLLPDSCLENYELATVPKKAPRRMTRQRLVFLPE